MAQNGRGLSCPECGGDTEVVDTRPADGAIRRRRRCVKCSWAFSTREEPVGRTSTEEALKIIAAMEAQLAALRQALPKSKAVARPPRHTVGGWPVTRSGWPKVML